MKTRDLIAALQAADPSGELEAVVGCDDIHFVEVQPMYYDGTPILLLRDRSKEPYYSVTGFRCVGRNGEQKVQIHTMGARDVLLDDPEATIELDESTSQYRAKFEALRQEMRDLEEADGPCVMASKDGI